MLHITWWKIFVVVALTLQIISQSVRSENTEVEKKMFDDAMNKFSQKMLIEISKDNKGNVLFSPLVVHLAVYMLADEAADGSRARRDLVKLLEFPSDNLNILENQYNDLIINSNKNALNIVRLANRLLVKSRVPKNHSELQKTIYSTDRKRLSIKSPTIAINNLIKIQSNEKTHQIVNEIENEVITMLTNVIHFKDSWILAFKKLKGTTRFTKADGWWERTEMIRQKSDQIAMATFKFEKILPRMKMTMVTIKYESDHGRFQMILVMPEHHTGLQKLLSSLDKKEDGELIFETIFRAARVANTNTKEHYVTMPVFDVKTDLNVEKNLKKLGVGKALAHGANFSKTDDGNGLSNSTIVTVAAKGTSASDSDRDFFFFEDSRKITIDKPFLFIIKDTVLDIVLFVGKITDPTKS